MEPRRAINTRGNHILKEFTLTRFPVPSGPDDFFSQLPALGITIEFTVLLRNRQLTSDSLERIMQAALSAADSEAELIDRGL